MNDYMSAHLYHNPLVATLIEKIIVASRKENAKAVLIELIDPFSDAKTGRVTTTLMPGAIWAEVFEQISHTGAIAVAIYRGESLTNEEVDEFQNEIPYVFTNPPSQTRIRKQDRVFILVKSENAWRQEKFGRRKSRAAFSRREKKGGDEDNK